MKNYHLLKVCAISIYLLDATAYADGAHKARPDDHAPIGVMRDHVHSQGEVMTSYRLGYMKMKGLQDGTDSVSDSEALESYNMIPTEMTVRAHMIGMMYGVTDQLTVSAMGSFLEKDMNNFSSMNGSFSRQSEGVGDTKVNASYKFYSQNDAKALFSFSVSLPTGDIDESYDGTRLAYSMQIGSGSYDVSPGFSYNKNYANYSYGAQVNATFRTEMNDNGYKLGDQYNSTVWGAKKLNASYSVSTRLNYYKTEAIEGSDSALMVGMMPGTDASLYDREKLELLVGVNFIANTNNVFDGNRLAVEFGMPVYEKVDGPMLSSDFRVVAGWQKAF